VEFGKLREPVTELQKMMREKAAGYGGVLRKNGGFRITAKAWIWPLLLHELVKGSMSLLCMHGFASMERSVYDAVLYFADALELEPWEIQAGPGLWRRLLDALPENANLPYIVMHISSMSPARLEELMSTLVEDQSYAMSILHN